MKGTITMLQERLRKHHDDDPNVDIDQLRTLKEKSKDVPPHSQYFYKMTFQIFRKRCLELEKVVSILMNILFNHILNIQVNEKDEVIRCLQKER